MRLEANLGMSAFTGSCIVSVSVQASPQGGAVLKFSGRMGAFSQGQIGAQSRIEKERTKLINHVAGHLPDIARFRRKRPRSRRPLAARPRLPTSWPSWRASETPECSPRASSMRRKRNFSAGSRCGRVKCFATQPSVSVSRFRSRHHLEHRLGLLHAQVTIATRAPGRSVAPVHVGGPSTPRGRDLPWRCGGVALAAAGCHLSCSRPERAHARQRGATSYETAWHLCLGVVRRYRQWCEPDLRMRATGFAVKEAPE